MKTILINAVAGCLMMCMGVSVQGAYTYTTLAVPGASDTRAYGIDDGNIVGWYATGNTIRGFSATIPEPATLSLLTLGTLILLRRRR